MGNAAGAAGSLFGPGEIRIIGFGTGGYGQDTHNVTEEQTVQQTTIVSETHLVTKTTYTRTFVPARVGPGFFILTPVQTKVPVTTKHPATTSHKVKTTRNVAGIQGGFGGAGAEAKDFFTRMLGVGLDGDWRDGGGCSGPRRTTDTRRSCSP